MKRSIILHQVNNNFNHLNCNEGPSQQGRLKMRLVETSIGGNLWNKCITNNLDINNNKNDDINNNNNDNTNTTTRKHEEGNTDINISNSDTNVMKRRLSLINSNDNGCDECPSSHAPKSSEDETESDDSGDDSLDSFQDDQVNVNSNDRDNNHQDEKERSQHAPELTPTYNLEPSSCPSDMSPDAYLKQLFESIAHFEPVVRPTLELSSLSFDGTHTPFIPPTSDEDMANYGVDVVTAAREEDLPTLRKIQSTGRSLSCCNRYGESILHMACRRGFSTIVLFLVNEANVSIRITDDCGRTPLHDALWNRQCQYAIVDLLVRTEPALLLTCDKRGHTPFAYCRREHWPNWRQFLWERREHMKNAMDANVMELFRQQHQQQQQV